MKYSLFVFVLGLTTSSFACDCEGGRPRMTQLLQQSASVFIGKVKSYKLSSKTIVHNENNFEFVEDFIEIEFEVIESFTNDTTKYKVILNDHSSCGQTFEIGKTYLLYTFYKKETDALHLHECHSFCPEITQQAGIQDLKEIRSIIQK